MRIEKSRLPKNAMDSAATHKKYACMVIGESSSWETLTNKQIDKQEQLNKLLGERTELEEGEKVNSTKGRNFNNTNYSTYNVKNNSNSHREKQSCC